MFTKQSVAGDLCLTVASKLFKTRVSLMRRVSNTPGNGLEIYKVSRKLPGSVRPFVANAPDSCVSKVFNVSCTKSPVENILQ